MTGQRIELAKAEFPYLVQQENTLAHSFIEITRTRHSEAFFSGERTLFYLVNPELRADDTQNIIKVHHTFATDDEDDASKIGWFEFSIIKFIGSYGSQLNFQGALTKVGFYPNPLEDPFIGAVEKKGRDKWGYSKNTGYPYTPPEVVIPGLPLPSIVDFSLYVTNDPERTTKWLKKAMASHKKARLQREREERRRAAERAAKEKERAERRERVRAWLATPEGQEYDQLHERYRAMTRDERVAFRDTDEGKRHSELQEVAFSIE